MSLGRYYLDARNLSPEVRASLFKKIDESSFITAIDLKSPGCIEVFWDSKTNFVEAMGIPSECKITVLCDPE